MNRLNLFILILFGISFSLSAQSKQKTDSLISVLNKTRDSDQKTGILIQLSIEYETTDLQKSFDFAKKALQEAEKKKTSNLLSEAYNNIANVYEYRSITDSSLIFHKKALELRLKNKDFTKIGDSHNNIGIAYDKQGDFPKALENYFKALRNFESEEDPEKQAMVLSNVGIVYKAQGEYGKALEYYKKANRIYKALESDFGVAVSEGNIGGVLLMLKRYDESIEYSERSKKLYEKIGYERYAVYPLVNIATANDSLKNYVSAEQIYLQAIALHKKHQDAYETAHTLKSYAALQLKQKKFPAATNALMEALQYTKTANAALLEAEVRKNLADVYSETGNFPEAFRHLNRYVAARDSLFHQEKTKAVFELEKQYQTEKKERQILEQRAELAESKLKIERKNQGLYGLGFVAVLLGLIAYQIYRTQKLKNLQLQKENQLKDALFKIESQKKVQEERLRISRDLHDNIGSQLTFIISSLDNLKFRLQNENPESSQRIDQLNHFTRNTITELRDTIWAMSKENISLYELKDRVNNFMDQAKSSVTDVCFEVNLDNSIEDNYSFTALEGINIYRTIQEAVNNAVKHSKASEIKVFFERNAQNFVIRITDNGKGFTESMSDSGNGLNNMKRRISEIGAQFEIFSNQKEGTICEIRF